MLNDAIWVAKILLTKAFAVVVLLSPAQAVLLLADRHRPVAWTTALSAVLAVALSIPGWYGYGLLGVAMAFAIGPLVGGLLILPEGWRFARMSMVAYLRRVVVPVLLPLAVLLGILVGALSLGWVSLLERVAASAVAGLLYVSLYLATQREDRELITLMLRKR